jgi:hypothetical protein
LKIRKVPRTTHSNVNFFEILKRKPTTFLTPVKTICKGSIGMNYVRLLSLLLIVIYCGVLAWPEVILAGNLLIGCRDRSLITRMESTTKNTTIKVRQVQLQFDICSDAEDDESVDSKAAKCPVLHEHDKNGKDEKGCPYKKHHELDVHNCPSFKVIGDISEITMKEKLPLHRRYRRTRKVERLSSIQGLSSLHNKLKAIGRKVPLQRR